MELRPQGVELRQMCATLIERAPSAPLPILSAAKSAAFALDHWLENVPLHNELNRLRDNCDAILILAKIVGA